ncbi:hypothetical protein D3C81_1512450 [compost metagenome]
MRGVLRHVGGRAAVLAAERQALQHAQRDQDDRGRPADGGVAGQQAHQEGGEAHDQDGDQEGVLAADHVAQATEHQRAERAHQEARRKGQQREDERRGGVQAREELLGDDRRQGAVQVEVVPLEYRAKRRGHDDLPLLACHWRVLCTAPRHCHVLRVCHYCLLRLIERFPVVSGHACADLCIEVEEDCGR